MGLLSESLAIRMKVGRDSGNASITFIPLLASAQLFGPAAAMILMPVTGAFGEFVVRRKVPLRGVFNVAQWTVATFAGGWAFLALGGTALEPRVGVTAAVALSGQLLPFVAFGLVFVAVNHLAVSSVVALSQGLRFTEVLSHMLGHSGASRHDILISPIAIAVAFLYVQVGVAGILLVLLPLLFIRHSYLTTSRLREANADLLKALVKAIETRDPYTSGHSLRVAYLAKRIGEDLGLPRGSVEQIEQAALLHDIGKIESVYSGILSKPSGLTADERAVIQSHVTKGEALLRNLSSLPEPLILTVRHHHEKEDGTGYPDGLAGEKIPMGARIVAVCDAVDAMLSDRPYRPALSVPTVMEELRKNAGTQFSPAIVDALIGSDLIAEYADIMRASKEPGELEVALSVVQQRRPPQRTQGITSAVFGPERSRRHVS
jgi:putative nucleotidyltransferase with HDIG domain